MFHIKIISVLSKIAGYHQLLQISTGLNGEFSTEHWRLEMLWKWNMPLEFYVILREFSQSIRTYMPTVGGIFLT
jgi:hypothetical protein